MDLTKLRSTTDNKLAGSVRLGLAIIFLMTGPMKLLVPTLAEAWSGQLLAANLPFYTLTRWTVPFLELFLGAVLAFGLFVRPAALVVIGIMAAATYVHLIVDDPDFVSGSQFSLVDDAQIGTGSSGRREAPAQPERGGS